MFSFFCGFFSIGGENGPTRNIPFQNLGYSRLAVNDAVDIVSLFPAHGLHGVETPHHFDLVTVHKGFETGQGFGIIILSDHPHAGAVENHGYPETFGGVFVEDIIDAADNVIDNVEIVGFNGNDPFAGGVKARFGIGKFHFRACEKRKEKQE